MTSKINRPREDEYAPFYAGYVQRVPDGDLFDLFAQQINTLRALLSKLTVGQADFRFFPGEWSIKELVGHLVDAERIFAYRALCISRGEQASLPGFEQDDYVRQSNFGERTLPDLLEEFELIRRANILAFNHLSDEASHRWGTASNTAVSVRAVLYIMAGHVAYHVESLQQDYLAKL